MLEPTMSGGRRTCNGVLHCNIVDKGNYIATPTSQELCDMTVTSREIAVVRAFNRDYTRRIGVLGEAYQDTPYSLTEARVMYEIAHRPQVSAAELAADLSLD